MRDAVLDLRDIYFQWSGPAGFALSIPSFSVETGETVLLLGESGSGKSTLLSLACGTIAPQKGTVMIAGQPLNGLSSSQRDKHRAEHVGVIFQQFNLLPFGSVEDNITLPLRFAPQRRSRVGNIPDAAKRLCAALELPKDVISTKAGNLSVGQQQRVAVARALIGAPPLVVADEPTSALDTNTQIAFLDLLFEQAAAQQSAILMVSHDPRMGQHFDRVIEMTDIAAYQRPAA